MDGIYSKLTSIAQMQKDLISDGEAVTPISDIGYYSEMDYDCGTWPQDIADAIAKSCADLAEEFAVENDYRVVKITEHKAYTQLDLYERECSDEYDNAWELKLLLSLCAPARNGPESLACGVNAILVSYMASHAEMIVV